MAELTTINKGFDFEMTISEAVGKTTFRASLINAANNIGYPVSVTNTGKAKWQAKQTRRMPIGTYDLEVWEGGTSCYKRDGFAKVEETYASSVYKTGDEL